MVAGCGQQLRLGAAGAVGLDFGAVLAMGQALDADPALLAEILPRIEAIRVRSLTGDGAADSDVPEEEI